MAEKGLRTLEELIRFCIVNRVSDVHLKPDRPPILRRGNSLIIGSGSQSALTGMDIIKIIEPALTEPAKKQFREKGEADLGWGIPGVGRFRINLFRSRAGTSAALRVITDKIPSIDELNLPKTLEKMSLKKQGLVLVTGATGQGKSTTLAAMINYINKNRAAHIITIEDPVEYMLKDNKSLITQRQVGLDTDSFASGLRAALRQDPDVILVGEMRDTETMETAINAAETGHLVFSTMHTTDAKDTLNRIMESFPPDNRSQVRYLVSNVLRGVVSIRLVERKGSKARVPACEIMVVTPRIRDLLREPNGIDIIPQAIAEGKTLYGMQTFDQSLFAMFKEGLIDYAEAKKNASNPADFELKFKGIS